MIIFLPDFCFFDLTDFFRFVMIFIRKFYTEKQKNSPLCGEFFFRFFAFFVDFYHAYSVGYNRKNAEPDGNVIMVINIVNRPHDKSDYDHPFEPHNVLCIDIPGEHTRGNYRDSCYGVCGYC